MILHQFQLSYLRQQRDYTNKRKTYVVLLQLEVTKKSFFFSPISGRGSNPSSPQLSGGAVGLKTIILHFDHGASFGFRGIWLWSCWHDTSQRSREHSAFEDERQRRRTWIAWEGGRRQESFMILKQRMEEWIISNKVKQEAEVWPIHTTWYLYSK